MLPGQLIDLPFQKCDTFREVRRRYVNLLQNLPIINFNSSQARTAHLAGALEEVAFMKNQALSKRIPVMRENMHYLVAINRNRLICCLFARNICASSGLAGQTGKSQSQRQDRDQPSYGSHRQERKANAGWKGKSSHGLRCHENHLDATER